MRTLILLISLIFFSLAAEYLGLQSVEPARFWATLGLCFYVAFLAFLDIEAIKNKK